MMTLIHCRCCKTNPEDRISPKELKMESWIAKHCRSQPPSARGGGGGSDRSSESSAVGSRDHIPKSDSRQGLNKEVFDRSKSGMFFTLASLRALVP